MSATPIFSKEVHQAVPALAEQGPAPPNQTMSIFHTHTDGTLHRIPSKFETVPEEILEIILKFLVQEPAKLRGFKDRASLSFESFASTLPHVQEDASNILKFVRYPFMWRHNLAGARADFIYGQRLLCKKFANRGRSLVYSRVRIRSTKLGFRRIHSLAAQPELAAEVQKVSYMVHDFYPQDEDTWQQLLQDARSSTRVCERRFHEHRDSHTAHTAQSNPAFRRLEAELGRCRRNEDLIIQAMARAQEQAQILSNNEDEAALMAALSSFKNLAQIRLMRNTDELDRRWTAFLNSASLTGVTTHSFLRRQSLDTRWTASCERAALVLARAYSESNSTASRLSSRFMDPGPLWLRDHISNKAVLDLASDLTCLELQIDNPANLEDKMDQLFTVFRILFKAAKNIEGLHIGLSRPKMISLETTFENVKWKNLQYVGFSRWHLTSDGIMNFLDRYRGSLQSVRFREVKLTQGNWIDVVKYMRKNTKLSWVSLREVGYWPHIGGGSLPEAAPGLDFARLLRPPPDDYEEYSSGSSDDIGEHVASHGAARGGEQDDSSSSEDDHSVDNSDSDSTAEAFDSAINGIATNVSNDEDSASEEADQAAWPTDGWADSPPRSIAGDSEVEVVNSFALDDQVMVEHSSMSVDANTSCRCDHGLAWDDLEDDHGLDPTKPQWKKWERWVIRPCSQHDPETF